MYMENGFMFMGRSVCLWIVQVYGKNYIHGTCVYVYEEAWVCVESVSLGE